MKIYHEDVCIIGEKNESNRNKENTDFENESLEMCSERMESSDDVTIIHVEKRAVSASGKPQTHLEGQSKVRRSKAKTNRGEKRKLSTTSDPSKKSKKKKKDEKLSTNINQSIKLGSDCDVIDCPVTPEETNNVENRRVNESTPSENESGLLISEDKSKPLSARKLKAVTKACREALDILMKFNIEILQSMDVSLKLLKKNNILDNRHITIDTLMELIELALETCKASEEIVMEKEMNFSKIMSNITTCKTPKSSKTKSALLTTPITEKPDSKFEEEIISNSVSNENDNDCRMEAVIRIQREDEKAEECESTVEHVENIGKQCLPDKLGRNSITNYFKTLKKTVQERDKNERFSSFTTKTDMFMAPRFGGELSEARRLILEEELNNQTCDVSYLASRKKSTDKNKLRKSLTNLENIKSSTVAEDDGKKNDSGEVQKSDMYKRRMLVKLDAPNLFSRAHICRNKAKLFQFHDNRRPPYWGTWRRKSVHVGPRKPFGKDKVFNYEIDSDEEWEGEEEPGESLHGSDDEKEPEEDYEVDNDFFVPHGYLSDDENPEKENVPIKAKLNLLEEQFSSELNQKTRKMVAIACGTYWVHKGLPGEGSLYGDLQLERLRYIPWTNCPIQIVDEENKKNDLPAGQETPNQAKKSRVKVTFPDEEIPSLIKIIHGSPQNSDELAKKFLNYWQTEKTSEGGRSSLTKKCVLQKIKELASWQASQEKKKMCWLVPKETRKEFGAEVDPEPAEKKPQKCYIWKFIKKGDKKTGLASEMDAKEAQEVTSLESRRSNPDFVQID